MDGIFLEPWLPPLDPALGRLAMEAADEEGLERCPAWPEIRMGGVAFGTLPVFLGWHGLDGGRHHLVLVQPRELGALVPGARTGSLPPSWLDDLDLDSLARPLARHPAFPGGAAIHLVQVPGPGVCRVRTRGGRAPAVVAGVLARLSGIQAWDCRWEGTQAG